MKKTTALLPPGPKTLAVMEQGTKVGTSDLDAKKSKRYVVRNWNLVPTQVVQSPSLEMQGWRT